MNPNNGKFDDLDLMLLSLFNDDDNGDFIPSFVPSTTFLGPPLPEDEGLKDTCSSSVTINNENEKDEGKNCDVSSSSCLLGKRRDVRERESAFGSCKKVKGNNGVCENFVGFPDRCEIDDKYSELGQKGRENCELRNCLGGGSDHDHGSGELLELLPSHEVLLDPVRDEKVEFLVDEEEDCGEMGSIEGLLLEISGSAQFNDEIGCDELMQILNSGGEMDPAIDDEVVNNQNLVGDRGREEIDTLVNLEEDCSERLVVEIVINLILD